MSSSATRYLPGFLREATPSRLTAGRVVSREESTKDQRVLDNEVSDEALMSKVRVGDKDALACLFRRYARLVRCVALRILGDSSEADDLLQDMFLFIHRKAGIFDPIKCSARSWIVQMTYHRAIDRRRYLNSRHFYTRLELSETKELSDRYSAETEDVESFAYAVGNTTISTVLDTLTDDQRNTLSLHFVEGFTFAEIAVKLDQSVGNIRNHYYRALEKLRKQMFPFKLPGRSGYGRK